MKDLETWTRPSGLCAPERRLRLRVLRALSAMLLYSLIVGFGAAESTAPGCILMAQAAGSVSVALSPQGAVTAGARWRIDGGMWRTSGSTATAIAAGTHSLTFKAVTGYKTPAGQGISVSDGITTTTTATYVAVGSVTATILPAQAITEGAKWHVDSGAWQNSGTTLGNITEGAHTVSFSTVNGWTSPAKIAITVIAGATSTVSGTYKPVGKVSVTLLPAAAATAGARWRLDGGTWRATGVTLSSIAEGPHTIDYKPVTAWVTPSAVSFSVVHAQTSTLTGTYTQTGKLSVQILPAPAVTEGATWAVDGGPMNPSGTTLAGIAPGSHTITFSSVAGWTSPVTSTLSVTAGQTATTMQVYKLTLGSYVMFANNDLGMHCMNQDFSELMILPPYNTVHAQVIRRGGEPQLMTSGVTINYSVSGNTTSVTKTNFWDYAPDLFGVDLPADVGLTGNKLAGKMVQSTTNEADYVVTGIPLTQITDAGENKPLQIGDFRAIRNGVQIARTDTVIPVSWEISCNLCHTGGPGVSPFTDILQKHDALHGTDLVNEKPVVCGSCHAQPELGLAGAAGVPTLSSSMHASHANRIPSLGLDNGCYACHPGITTQCQRDIHRANGISCEDCHGGMADVGNPVRAPWSDEPKCGSCHKRSGFSFEQSGKLYRDSKGHHEVECWVCHGSPHAITPTVTNEDNIQAQMMQGHSGVLDCVVCHINKPSDEFEHHL